MRLIGELFICESSIDTRNGKAYKNKTKKVKEKDRPKLNSVNNAESVYS